VRRSCRCSQRVKCSSSVCGAIPLTQLWRPLLTTCGDNDIFFIHNHITMSASLAPECNEVKE